MTFRGAREITPFIAAPGTGMMQQQLAVSLDEFPVHPGELVDLVSRFTLSMGSDVPFVSQVQWLRGYLVLSITVQTHVPEAFSGRKGLNVTCGALVPAAEMGRSNLFTEILEAIRRYFISTLGGDISVETVSRALLAKVTTHWSADGLRSAFGQLPANRRPALDIIAQPVRWLSARYRLSRMASLFPANSLADVTRHWAILDQVIKPQGLLSHTASERSHLGQFIAICLVALCMAHLLGFAAIAWPSAPRYWRAALAFCSALVSLSTATIIFDQLSGSKPSSALLKTAALVAGLASTVVFFAAVTALWAILL